MSWIMDKINGAMVIALIVNVGIPKSQLFFKWLGKNWILLLIPILLILAKTGLSKTATKVLVLICLGWVLVQILPYLKKQKNLRYARVGNSYRSPNFDLDDL